MRLEGPGKGRGVGKAALEGKVQDLEVRPGGQEVGGLFQAKPLQEAEGRLSRLGHEDAQKVVGREAGLGRKVLQGEGPVKVGVHKVENAVDSGRVIGHGIEYSTGAGRGLIISAGGSIP